MGKASSAKKIARAARAGGRASGVRQLNLLFPGAIAAIVVLGTGLVFAARSEHRDDASRIAPIANQDHWHSAYSIYVCDQFLPVTPAVETPPGDGIHSHGDGVIHIHPNSDAGGGENATLGKYLESTDEIQLSDDELKVGEETWKEGDDKCGDEDGEVVVARWQDVQTTDDEPSIIKSDFDDLRFRSDGEGYVIAFVAEGDTDIPKPENAAQLAELGAVDDPTATTLPPDPTATTLPGDPSATTLPPDPSATTVPPDS